MLSFPDEEAEKITAVDIVSTAVIPVPDFINWRRVAEETKENQLFILSALNGNFVISAKNSPFNS